MVSDSRPGGLAQRQLTVATGRAPGRTRPAPRRGPPPRNATASTTITTRMLSSVSGTGCPRGPRRVIRVARDARSCGSAHGPGRPARARRRAPGRPGVESTRTLGGCAVPSGCQVANGHSRRELDLPPATRAARAADARARTPARRRIRSPQLVPATPWWRWPRLEQHALQPERASSATSAHAAQAAPGLRRPDQRARRAGARAHRGRGGRAGRAGPGRRCRSRVGIRSTTALESRSSSRLICAAHSRRAAPRRSLRR